MLPALGIGANTAVFALVNTLLLRQPPVGHPAALALLTAPTIIGASSGLRGDVQPLLAYSQYEALRDHDPAFRGLMAAQSYSERMQVNWSDAPERAHIKLVSPNYFSVLQVPLAETGALVLGGLCLGVPASPAVARLLAHQVFAAFLPARSASRVDPLSALRHD